MRKALCIILALVLCLFATGNAELKTVAVKWLELNGKEENGVYENKFLGLGFSMEGWSRDPDWMCKSDEEDSDKADSEETIIDMPEYFMIQIFEAFTSEERKNVYITIQHLGENIGEDENEFYVKELMNNRKTFFSERGYENARVEYATVNIGEREYQGMASFLEINGVSEYSRVAVFIQDHYLVRIEALTKQEDKTEEIFQHFFELKDSEV